MGKKALLLGATGLVGGHVLERLLADEGWSSVRVLARAKAPLVHPKLTWKTVDFDDPSALEQPGVVDDVFCCLGTTIKKAGSQEAFRRVDLEIPLALARAVRRDGASRFLLVSAMGADPRSALFYSRIKGELEQALDALGFPSLVIFRPSLLLGKRSEPRLAEAVAGALSRPLGALLLGPLKTYRPIEASDVARAMVAVARSSATGPLALDSRRIHEIARQGWKNR